MLGYTVGVRMLLAARRRAPSLAMNPDALWVAVGAVLGAALGSKLLFWLQFPSVVYEGLPNPRALLPGKTIVGGLLGGVAGVELAKRRLRIRESTGDVFTFAVLAGLAIGRLGCLFLGLQDGTAGSPTALPWGIDYGDGVIRHPVPAYEIAFLFALRLALARLPPPQLRPGDTFRLFMLAYLSFRFLADFGKPPFDEAAFGTAPRPHLYGGVLTAIQIACLLGVGYHALSWNRARRPTRDA